MKLKINFKKIISVFMVIVVICTTFTGISNSVYGKVNSVYEQSNTTATIDLDEASSNSTVLEAVGYFVYAIATFAEETIGNIIGSFTGSSIFPWADRVIFNTIEFLDINFLSPSNGSMFRNTSGDDTIFGSMIKNVYYTIFTISATFFGVVVGVMALKLAISSIAAEKAKYKQAITNWVLALILLFTSHYLMSFIFFVNEKMVEVASKIFLDQIEANEDNIQLDMSLSNDQDSLDKLFNVLFEGYYAAWGAGVDIYSHRTYKFDLGNLDGLGDVAGYEYIKLATASTDGKSFQYKFYTNFSADGKQTAYYKYNILDNRQAKTGDLGLEPGWNLTDSYSTVWKNVKKYTWSLSDEDNKLVEQKFKYYLNALLASSGYLEIRDGLTEMSLSATFLEQLANNVIILDNFFNASDYFYRDFRRYINDALYLVNCDTEVRTAVYGEGNTINTSLDTYCKEMLAGYMWNDSENYGETMKNILRNLVNTAQLSGEAADANPYEIINNLADYFKQAIYISNVDLDADTDNGEEVFNVVFQPIVAILYAIFVVQSVMFFIAYMKRFFYIIVLALFAPLIIVYDFLMKSTLG